MDDGVIGFPVKHWKAGVKCYNVNYVTRQWFYGTYIADIQYTANIAGRKVLANLINREFQLIVAGL